MKMGNHLVGEDDIILLLFRQIFPVDDLEGRVNPMPGGAGFGRRHLHGGNGNSVSYGAKFLAQINNRPAPAAAHIQNLHPRFQMHKFGKLIKLFLFSLGDIKAIFPQITGIGMPFAAHKC